MRPSETTQGNPPHQNGVIDIAQLRQRIDTIDDEIIELVQARIELSSLVMKMKSPTQLVDPTREQSIIARYFEKLSDTSTLPKIKRLVAGIIGASRIYPE